MYKIKGNFNTAMAVLIPKTKNIQGVPKKIFPTFEEITDDMIIMGKFRTFGGTETTSNGTITLHNTATIECWYNPIIQADCRICLMDSKDIYEIIGTPEDIEMRHQFLKFRVKKLGGRP